VGDTWTRKMAHCDRAIRLSVQYTPSEEKANEIVPVLNTNDDVVNDTGKAVG
jgi:hypothetical protein